MDEKTARDKNTIRILKILRGDDIGGVYTCEMQFITYWQNNNCAVDGLIVGNGEAAQNYKSILNNSYEIEYFNQQATGSLLNIIFSIKHSNDYGRRILRNISFPENYDALIYRHKNLINLAGKVGQKFNIQPYWFMPNNVNRTLGKLYYNILLKFYGIKPVANSNFSRLSLGKICKDVIYPGFNKSRVSKIKQTYRNELNIPENAIVFGNASRIEYNKGQDLLINSLIKTGLLEQNVYCLIAGGPLNTLFAKKIENLSKKYSKKIYLLGNITDLPKFYSSIDIYVNSRRNAEPFGISVVEAMGAGLPVIAFKEGGPSETVIENINGWLINKPTIDSYCKTIKKAFLMKNNWDEMGASSKSLSQKYEANNNAENFLKLIKNYY